MRILFLLSTQAVSAGDGFNGLLPGIHQLGAASQDVKLSSRLPQLSVHGLLSRNADHSDQYYQRLPAALLDCQAQ